MSYFSTPPINWLDIENAIHYWMSTYGNIVTIWGLQDSPQPIFPFASLNLVSGPTRVGSYPDEQQVDNGDNTVTVYYLDLQTFTINCAVDIARSQQSIISKSEEVLSEALAALQIPSVNEELRSVGLAVEDIGAINSFDYQLEDRWISRSVCDIVFRVTSVVSEVVSHIESTSITWENVTTISLVKE